MSTLKIKEQCGVDGLLLLTRIKVLVRVLFNLRWTLPFDKFPNIDRVKNIDCPIFVIHGRRDEIVPFYHAQELYAASKNKYQPFYVDGAGHNNIEKFANTEYLLRINKFIQDVDIYVKKRTEARLAAQLAEEKAL